VQDHPDDDYARAHEGGKLGKTEAWRILRAEPDARIIHGLARATTRDEVAQAIRASQLEELTYSMPVTAGDVIINEAGTLHATGAGIVLYEIQEYSDVTYRLYDYGRVDGQGRGRELHIDKGLEVLNYHPLPRHLLQSSPIEAGLHKEPIEQLLVADRHFALSELRIDGEYPTRRATDGTSCHILTVIEGQAQLTWGSTAAPVGLTLTLGDTVVLPAEPATYHLELDPSDGHTQVRLLNAWVPIADDPNVAKWQAANQ
jgi:mannose-6-phosphate isomerase